MILLTYRHGLRVSELVDLRVGDLDLRTGTIHCRRTTGSRSGLHPMKKDEVDAVKTVLRGRKVKRPTTYSYPIALERWAARHFGRSSRRLPIGPDCRSVVDPHQVATGGVWLPPVGRGL